MCSLDTVPSFPVPLKPDILNVYQPITFTGK